MAWNPRTPWQTCASLTAWSFRAATALSPTGVPSLVFPSGTACQFFNNIGNAPEAAALAKACRAGRTVKVDMGELFWLDENGNEKLHGFIIIAGSGFDA